MQILVSLSVNFEIWHGASQRRNRLRPSLNRVADKLYNIRVKLILGQFLEKKNHNLSRIPPLVYSMEIRYPVKSSQKIKILLLDCILIFEKLAWWVCRCKRVYTGPNIIIRGSTFGFRIYLIESVLIFFFLYGFNISFAMLLFPIGCWNLVATIFAFDHFGKQNHVNRGRILTILVVETTVANSHNGCKYQVPVWQSLRSRMRAT